MILINRIIISWFIYHILSLYNKNSLPTIFIDKTATVSKYDAVLAYREFRLGHSSDCNVPTEGFVADV